MVDDDEDETRVAGPAIRMVVQWFEEDRVDVDIDVDVGQPR